MEINDKTKQDLMSAFAGESQANRKYLAFAKQADSEGYAQAAKLFRAAAASETVHAHHHLRFVGGVGDTKANLNTSIEGEDYEHEKMYPEFTADAEAAGDTKVAEYLKLVARVEKEHAGLYRGVLEALGENENVSYFVCGHCGHVNTGGAPEKCPVCGMPKTKFMEID